MLIEVKESVGNGVFIINYNKCVFNFKFLCVNFCCGIGRLIW